MTRGDGARRAPIGRFGRALLRAIIGACALTIADDARAAGPETADAAPSILGGLAPVRDELEADGWLVHGQFTVIGQGHPEFKSPYAGASSLTSGARARETVSFGPVIGRQLWDGAAVYVNPEWDQGFGVNSSRGVGGALNN